MTERLIYCGYCGKEHKENSSILMAHQRLIGDDSHAYGKKEVSNMKTKKVDNCQLEVDKQRGVLYVHGPNGITLVRVCQIPLAVVDNESIDIVYDRELARGGTTRQVRMDFRSLAREELLHLIDAWTHYDSMMNRFKTNLKWQRTGDLRCWTCESIARKLGITVKEGSQEKAKMEVKLSLADLAVKVDLVLIRRAQLLKAAGIIGKGWKSPV